MDGCDAMTCGRDAADKGGGNQQDGCGQRFDWSRAQRYKRGDDKAQLPRGLDSVDPASAPKQKHHILSTENHLVRADSMPYRIKCSACTEDIVGPLFSCINCYGWNCCIDCEPHLSSIHDPTHGKSILYPTVVDVQYLCVGAHCSLLHPFR